MMCFGGLLAAADKRYRLQVKRRETVQQTLTPETV